MKTLVLGDIHGRLIWHDIIQKEQPDRVIFLGDYVATHESISPEQQISNLEDILNYKEDNPDTTVLLRGNHCMQHLGYSWAECSGLEIQVYAKMSQSEFKERFLNLTQWLYIDKELKTIFSHAGVSTTWLLDVENYIVTHSGAQYDNGTIDQEVLLDTINTIEPCPLFGFSPNSPYDTCGTSNTQPLTWIRPKALYTYNVEGYDQVVGHTPLRNICKLESPVNKQIIWLCDSLGDHNYLIIENGKFSPKNYEKGTSKIL